MYTLCFSSTEVSPHTLQMLTQADEFKTIIQYNYVFANTGRECFSPVKRVILHSCVSILWCGWGNLYLVSALECLKIVFKKKNHLVFLYIRSLFFPLQDAKNLNKSLSIYEESYQAKESLSELLFTFLVCLKPFMRVIFLNSVVHVLWEWLAGCTGFAKCLQIKKKKKAGDNLKGFCKGAALRSSPSWQQSFAFGAWGSVCPVLFLQCLGRHKGWSSLCSTLAPRD